MSTGNPTYVPIAEAPVPTVSLVDNTPHFDLPFRFQFGSVVCVEQDTVADVANCVTAILATHIGWRDEVPVFGIPEQTFLELPLDLSDLERTVVDQDSRAILFLTETIDKTDELVDTVNVKVATVTGGDNA